MREFQQRREKAPFEALLKSFFFRQHLSLRLKEKCEAPLFQNKVLEKRNVASLKYLLEPLKHIVLEHHKLKAWRVRRRPFFRYRHLLVKEHEIVFCRVTLLKFERELFFDHSLVRMVGLLR